MVLFLNCFSTKQINSVPYRATKYFHDNDNEADDETNYRKKALGTNRSTPKTKTTSNMTWNKYEPCRNGRDVTTSWCKQEEMNRMRRPGTNSNNWRRMCAKWSRSMRSTFWPFQLGTNRKTTKTKTTSKTTWNKYEPCRNGRDVTTSWCKQEEMNRMRQPGTSSNN